MAGLPPAPERDPLDMTEVFNTILSDEEERLFQAWAGEKAADTYDYDLRGAWKALMTGEIEPDGRGHLPDKFKKPNHITFSNESMYSTEDTPGGRWIPLDEKTFAFEPSGFNMRYYNPDTYDQYFNEFEPGNKVIIAPAEPMQGQSVMPEQPSVNVRAAPNFYQVDGGATRFGGGNVSMNARDLAASVQVDSRGDVSNIEASYGGPVGKGRLSANANYQPPAKSYGIGVNYDEPNTSVGVNYRPKEKSVNVTARKKF